MLYAEKDRRHRLRALTTQPRLAPKAPELSATLARRRGSNNAARIASSAGKHCTLIVIPNKRSLRGEESGRAARCIAFFAMQ
jgi:hypothetical protein